MTYEYYDESQPNEQTYEYDAEEHTHENVTGDAHDAHVAVGDAPVAGETPKRSRRQAAVEQAEYAYDEAQGFNPEDNVKLLCCSFQRYLVT